MSNKTHFLGDNAISFLDEDFFNFRHYADKIKTLIQLNSSNPNPLTIGIYGKWGEGKTSFLNLIQNRIEHFEKDQNGKEYLKFNFNPWRYSVEEEMLFDFFDSLSKRFYVEKDNDIQEVGKWILKYSKYLKAVKISSTVGIPKFLNKTVEFSPDEVFKALGEDMKGEKLTLEILKNKVNDAIKKVNFKVVIFIDDVDRLDKNEIYTILKLIKLNANFDHFIFIIALDSEHVAKAIKDRYGDEIEDGYLFLEKIINIPIHLPRIENDDLNYFFKVKLKTILDNLSFLDDEKKSQFLMDLSSEISKNQFNSPREIVKILNSFFISAFSIGEEINLKDLFWLEFIKVRNEKCYSFLKSYVDNNIFKNPNSMVDFQENFADDPYEFRENKFSEFNNVKKILERLFPKNNENIYNNIQEITIVDKSLSVNSHEHYDKYFSYHMERKIGNRSVKEIEKSIVEENETGITNIIEELFTNSETINEDKIVYKIVGIIQGIKDKKQRDFFCKYLFKNIKLIPDTNNKEFRIEITQLIGKILNDDIDIENIPENGIPNNPNKDISVELANMAELEELTAFIRAFYQSRKVEFGLIDIYVKKVKIYVEDNPLFYKDPFNLPNKSIFYHLSEKEDSEFLISILNKDIKSIEDVRKLVRNFVPYYNSSFFGSINKEEYLEIKKRISIEFILNKVIEFDTSYLDNQPLFEKGIERTNKSTEDENLRQLLHWYLKENELDNKLNKILN
ncbi:KAP family P-loop NTPase fold protein [Flavobacterium dankookense]|uniref:KAP-like P-loop domain-containing protein n=1 Tax=Flavobacterium dankookense TaxID=706186 RepID=A0A4R6Q981_9FLAO|nr:P-loop NTPase fold protein [Flavobacterium dankookense]TDP58710.1 KAP-like P-loop domain-containing protein [Flavobacterium dankookense]